MLTVDCKLEIDIIIKEQDHFQQMLLIQIKVYKVHSFK